MAPSKSGCLESRQPRGVKGSHAYNEATWTHERSRCMHGCWRMYPGSRALRWSGLLAAIGEELMLSSVDHVKGTRRLPIEPIFIFLWKICGRMIEELKTLHAVSYYYFFWPNWVLFEHAHRLMLFLTSHWLLNLRVLLLASLCWPAHALLPPWLMDDCSCK
jgi:hypothetical protein